MNFLVLSNNQTVSQFVSRALKYENIYSDAKSFHEAFKSNFFLQRYTGVILKIQAGSDDFSFIFDEIMKYRRTIPVFLLSNLDIKLKDYTNKIPIIKLPLNFRAKKLGVEIKKHFSSDDKPIDEIIEVADLSLHKNSRHAARNGKTYYLRNKEYQLLEYLMRNTDQILTRQKILEDVWDRNASIFTNTVDVHINCLRKKIDNNPDKRLIETIFCLGYVMHSKSQK